jgi:DNA-directed RNA polymerase subunit RPC12/RpoP
MSQRNIKPPRSQEVYEKAANDLARMHAPRIYSCLHCGWPVAEHYVCGTCGSENPTDGPLKDVYEHPNN